MHLKPITLRGANAYIAEHHRHHKPARGCISCVSVVEGGTLCGVAVIGRPVARMLDDGYTAEVTRCCTNGEGNAPSKLYRAAWRAVKALGYRRLVTYTLGSEEGASLRGAGFVNEGKAGGGSWSRTSRQRTDTHPLEEKQRWSLSTTAQAPTK